MEGGCGLSAASTSLRATADAPRRSSRRRPRGFLRTTPPTFPPPTPRERGSSPQAARPPRRPRSRPSGPPGCAPASCSATPRPRPSSWSAEAYSPTARSTAAGPSPRPAAAKKAPLADAPQFAADMKALGDPGLISYWADVEGTISALEGQAGAEGLGAVLTQGLRSVAGAARVGADHLEIAITVGADEEVLAPMKAAGTSLLTGLPDSSLFASSATVDPASVDELWGLPRRRRARVDRPREHRRDRRRRLVDGLRRAPASRRGVQPGRGRPQPHEPARQLRLTHTRTLAPVRVATRAGLRPWRRDRRAAQGPRRRPAGVSASLPRRARRSGRPPAAATASSRPRRARPARTPAARPRPGRS